jgi:hypothetical protein
VAMRDSSAAGSFDEVGLMREPREDILSLVRIIAEGTIRRSTVSSPWGCDRSDLVSHEQAVSVPGGKGPE